MVPKTKQMTKSGAPTVQQAFDIPPGAEGVVSADEAFHIPPGPDAAKYKADATYGAPAPPLQPIQVAPPAARALRTTRQCPTADEEVQFTLFRPLPSADMFVDPVSCFLCIVGCEAILDASLAGSGHQVARGCAQLMQLLRRRPRLVSSCNGNNYVVGNELHIRTVCTVTGYINVASVSSLTTNACRVQYLEEGGASYISAVDVRGLVNIVPSRGAGDMPDKYCINGFAIDAYSELLRDRQRLHPRLCRSTHFVRTVELVRTSALFMCTCSYVTDAGVVCMRM